MNKTLICSTIGFFIFFACNKTESEEPTPSGLNGKWNLVSFEHCGGGADVYEKGDVIWSFDITSNTVSITNNVTISTYSPNFFRDNEVYNYELLNDGEQYNMVVYLNNREVIFKYTQIEHVLRLDRSCVLDGNLLLFER